MNEFSRKVDIGIIIIQFLTEKMTILHHWHFDLFKYVDITNNLEKNINNEQNENFKNRILELLIVRPISP